MTSQYQRLKYLFLSKLTRRTQAHSNDDFNWPVYTAQYKGDVLGMKGDYTLILKPGDYKFTGHLLQDVTQIPPLHPNHHLLYEMILQLNPESVLEVGCGCGDHLHNLNVLNPRVLLNGIDLLATQIEYLHVRHPDLHTKVSVKDATLPMQWHSEPRVDLAYTQTVLMHIHTGNNYLHALASMFRYARNWVVLMENPESHDYVQDVQYLFENDMIEWGSIHYYWKEYQGVKILVFSREVWGGCRWELS